MLVQANFDITADLTSSYVQLLKASLQLTLNIIKMAEYGLFDACYCGFLMISKLQKPLPFLFGVQFCILIYSVSSQGIWPQQSPLMTSKTNQRLCHPL
ncbi:hypothetical protein FGO68_gene4271 [Halteria grandinella]|uniref:Uncharacterized protein n=1 Tax=Halteria grandinella TaxID=5974 RepID=A0A8J8NNM1_HALGN|nr:hypothetical protein FGO68_gene4271 [Halteria grandinella]